MTEHGETAQKEHSPQKILASMQKTAERTREEATEEMIRTNREKRRKRKERTKRKIAELEKMEKEMSIHYGFLIIKEAELEKKMYDESLKLARKRRKQIGWVI